MAQSKHTACYVLNYDPGTGRILFAGKKPAGTVIVSPRLLEEFGSKKELLARINELKLEEIHET